MSEILGISKNRSSFLSVESQANLSHIFGAKKVGGKLKIEIGWQMLELKTIEKKKTKNGGEMMVLKWWKAPAEFEELKGKISYSTIDCYHILQRKSYGTFEDNWFKSFTTCLEESQFGDINKGSKWMCLVMQEEQLIEKQGEVVTYEKGNRAGEDVVRVIPKIIEIHPEDYDTSERKLDYLKLYKTLK